MPDWIKIVREMATALTQPPKTCHFWSCSRSIREDHFFCYEHFLDFKDGLIDECPGCNRGKDVQYGVCLQCKRNPPPHLTRLRAEKAHSRRQWYKPEYSALWEHGDASATQFFVYILKLDGGDFYAGQTRDLRARLTEHRDGRVQSTAHRGSKLVWFGGVPSREEATRIEVMLKERIDKNPREIRKMVINFRDLMRELDYS